MTGLEDIVLVKWSVEVDGHRIMDASNHTVRPEMLGQNHRYTLTVDVPAGVHPEELVSLLRGAAVTRATKPAPLTGDLQDRNLKLQQQVAELTMVKEGAEREMKRAQDQLATRDQADKDNKARLDALALLGTTVEERGVEKLIQTELNTWLRGLEEFNMTGGEAAELKEMLVRLVKEVFARAEVLRDRRRCACLLESLQRERDSEPKEDSSDVVDGDQLF